MYTAEIDFFPISISSLEEKFSEMLNYCLFLYPMIRRMICSSNRCDTLTTSARLDFDLLI